MRKFLKKQGGITLIALVITIIVLLILAGVAISMLSGENGILTRASEASKQTKKASTEEQVKLAVMSALTLGNGEIEGANAYKALNDGLKEAGYTGEEIAEGDLPKTITINGDNYFILENGTVREASEVEKNIGKEITGEKAILLDVNNEQIVVPVGFKIKEKSPTTVKRGIVVIAPDGSEFVWVPVKNAIYDSNNENVNKLPKNSTKGTLNGNDYTPMSISVDGTYKGILYEYSPTNGAYLKYSSATNFQGTTSQCREPDYLSNTTNGDAVTGDSTKGIELLKSIVGLTGTETEEILSTWQTQLQNEYKDMVESVEENKGFYVGRYETSLNATTKYAQSISGEKSATAAKNSANTWYGLYQKQKEYSANNNITNNVGSSMIWGSQYDQMMIWMQSNGINVKSETPINLEGIKTNRNISETTGSKAEDKLNNIYDLLGNRYEWTLEAFNTYGRINRGGVYNQSNTPSAHTSIYPCSPYSDNGSRLALYVK